MDKFCFLVSPIGEPGSQVRRRSNGFLREVIRPVAKEFGFQVERADHDKSPGMVTEAIVRKILEADLVIADLHDHNPNVMYEVALRHATGKPMVQMIPEEESLPFDIGGLNTIFYNPKVDGLEAWRRDLRLALETIEDGASGENPVSRAAIFRGLKDRSGTDAAAFSALLESIELLRHDVRSNLRRRSRPPRTANVLLPPDQLMEYELKEFLMSEPEFSERHFLVRVDDSTALISILPKGHSGPVAAELEYDFEAPPDGSLHGEIARLQSQIKSDVMSLPNEAEGDENLLATEGEDIT